MSRDSLRQVIVKPWYLRLLSFQMLWFKEFCYHFLSNRPKNRIHSSSAVLPQVQPISLTTNYIFFPFSIKSCSKALPVNILGDPGHHPVRQQCGLPVPLWLVGSTKGRNIISLLSLLLHIFICFDVLGVSTQADSGQNFEEALRN